MSFIVKIIGIPMHINKYDKVKNINRSKYNNEFYSFKFNFLISLENVYFWASETNIDKK